MKKLGIIGGLGPMATVYFLELVTQLSDAARDQEHMELLLHSKPDIPDRTGYIIGKSSEDPLPDMIEIARELERLGAAAIAIPCVTAHFFHERLQEAVGIPILHAIDATVAYLKRHSISAAGLLATDGTVESGLFQAKLSQAGIRCILPDREDQQRVMQIIYEQIKAGKEVDVKSFEEIAARLSEQGASVSLLGCTELSLIRRDHSLQGEFLDVMELLACQAVEYCGRLKPDVKNRL